MSILQKILQDMFVEPELLNELDDEQKQILFCKMREEQIRRYATDEKQYEEQQMRNKKKEKEPKIKWLLGQDGEPWVWVMGEHPADKTIDQIMEEETQEKARKLAEEEAEKLRLKEEEELKEKLRQEQYEAEQERRRLEKEEQETKRKLDETLKKLQDQTLVNNAAVPKTEVLFRKEAKQQKQFEVDAQKVSLSKQKIMNFLDTVFFFRIKTISNESSEKKPTRKLKKKKLDERAKFIKR